jgi:isopentenyl-diphosphate delta-isomerase
MEELGVSCKLQKAGHVLYRFYDQVSGLTEHEYDFIFTGKFDGPVPFNEEEVSEVRWNSSQQLKAELKHNPEKFTPWFIEILRQISY